MPTYVLSSRNKFRSPSGATNEAPDGPGAFQTLSQDIDDRLGVGGAEYTNLNFAAAGGMNSRTDLFVGKLVYYAPNDTVYRYVGVGGTSLGSAGGTAKWQGWTKPATAFTPSYANVGFTNPQTNIGLWGITEGMFWCGTWIQQSASAATTPSGNDASMVLPSPMVSQMGYGRGTWASGGSSSTNNQHELVCYPVGTVGGQTSTLRFRPVFANATGASVKQNNGIANAGIVGAASDWLSLWIQGPSGLNA